MGLIKTALCTILISHFHSLFFFLIGWERLLGSNGTIEETFYKRVRSMIASTSGELHAKTQSRHLYEKQGIT